jgi:hypothetical protein
VKCVDGVVIGADSVATSSAGVTPVMQIESNDKIRIFGENIIVAATGAVGYTQRLHLHVEAALKGGVFKNFDRDRRAQNICERFIKDLQSSMAPMHPHFGGVNFGALIATEIKGEPCLIEFATDNFRPEYKESKLFYVSIGSGQALADPFLAFVSRVLRRNQLPDVRMGRFGVYWVLSHTINLAPGKVGLPIRIATLAKNAANWVASEVPDLQQSEQFIAAVENNIGAFVDGQAGAVAMPTDPAVVPQV